MEGISKQNAKMTYNSLGIELECAWSAAPDTIARAPAENGKKGDKQGCKEDIRRPSTGARRGRTLHLHIESRSAERAGG